MLTSPWRAAVCLAIGALAVGAASGKAANQPSRFSGAISRQIRKPEQPPAKELDRSKTAAAEEEKKRRQLAVQYCMRGIMRAKTRKYEQALADFDTSLRIDPECPGGELGRGMCLQTLRRKKEAQQAFMRAVERNPESALTRYWLGFSLREAGDLDGAIEQLDVSLKIDPKSARAFAARAETWSQKGDYQRAMADVEKSLLIEPDNVAIYMSRAQIQNRAGHYREAREDSNKALKAAPANVKAAGCVWWTLLRLEQITNLGRKNEK